MNQETWNQEPFFIWIGRVLSLVLLVLALSAVAFESSDLLSPPFTDAELKTNQIDTWDAYVLGSLVFLAVFVSGLVVSAVGIRQTTGVNRALFLAASIAFAIAVTITIANVELLTQRLERLIGHDLSWI